MNDGLDGWRFGHGATVDHCDVSGRYRIGDGNGDQIVAQLTSPESRNERYPELGPGGGLSLTVWSALVIPLPAALLAVIIHGTSAVVDGLASIGWRSAVSTLYTAGLASLVGYGIFNTLLSRNRSSDVVPFVLLAPVVAMTLAALLLGQIPDAAETAGAITMVIGVLIVLRGAPRPPCTGPRTAEVASPGVAPNENTPSRGPHTPRRARSRRGWPVPRRLQSAPCARPTI